MGPSHWQPHPQWRLSTSHDENKTNKWRRLPAERLLSGTPSHWLLPLSVSRRSQRVAQLQSQPSWPVCLGHFTAASSLWLRAAGGRALHMVPPLITPPAWEAPPPSPSPINHRKRKMDQDDHLTSTSRLFWITVSACVSVVARRWSQGLARGHSSSQQHETKAMFLKFHPSTIEICRCERHFINETQDGKSLLHVV